MQQHVGVLQHCLLRIDVGDEIRRQVALVEADTFGDRQLGVQRRGLLDGDDAVGTDAGECLTHELADLRVTRGHRGDLRDGFLALDGCSRREQCLGNLVGSLGDTGTECDRVGACRDVLQASAHECLRQHGGRGGAVARNVVGLGGDALDELRTQVLERIFQIDLACDGDAVVGDRGATECLGEHHVSSARSERHLDGVGQLVDATLESPAGFLVELDLLCHVSVLLLRVDELD